VFLAPLSQSHLKKTGAGAEAEAGAAPKKLGKNSIHQKYAAPVPARRRIKKRNCTFVTLL